MPSASSVEVLYTMNSSAFQKDRRDNVFIYVPCVLLSFI